MIYLWKNFKQSIHYKNLFFIKTSTWPVVKYGIFIVCQIWRHLITTENSCPRTNLTNTFWYLMEAFKVLDHVEVLIRNILSFERVHKPIIRLQWNFDELWYKYISMFVNKYYNNFIKNVCGECIRSSCII